MTAPSSDKQAADEQRVLDSVPNGLLIDGRWRPAASGRTVSVDDPATGQSLVEVADGAAADALDALDAAHRAQPGWAATPPRERGEILRRAFEALTANAGDLALLMTLEMGKPVAESRAEITYAAEFFRWYSEEAVRIAGDYRVAPAGGSRLLVTRQPVGPCLFITPWNFPMAMGTRKIGPAVAAGCTMVLKPATLTPLSSLALAQILIDAGLPDGVLNVVTTSAAGGTTGPLIADPRLRKLSFTGSTEVGKRLIGAAAEQVLRVSMELGGNAPFLVFADADLDQAVEGAMLAKMRNGGEACTSANRFYVQRQVADDFANRLAQRMGSLRMGRGTEEGVTVGPLIDDDQRAKVAHLVDDAKAKGARVLCGGGAPSGPGAQNSQSTQGAKRRSSDRRRPSWRSTPRRTQWTPPTPPSTAWSPTPTRRIWTGRCGWPRGSRPAWSGSTRGSCPTRQPPLAASSSPASGGKAAARA